MFNLIKNHEDFCSSPWITMDFVCAFSFRTLTTLKPPKDWRLLLSSIVSSDSLIFFEARVSESSLCRFGALEAAIFSSLKPTVDSRNWFQSMINRVSLSSQAETFRESPSMTAMLCFTSRHALSGTASKTSSTPWIL